MIETFNVNEYVSVRLNELGHAVIVRNRKDFMARHPNVRLSMPVPDADGYVRFPLWELMQLFGEHMGLGKPVPFETEMRLERRPTRGR